MSVESASSQIRNSRGGSWWDDARAKSLTRSTTFLVWLERDCQSVRLVRRSP